MQEYVVTGRVFGFAIQAFDQPDGTPGGWLYDDAKVPGNGFMVAQTEDIAHANFDREVHDSEIVQNLIKELTKMLAKFVGKRVHVYVFDRGEAQLLGRLFMATVLDNGELASEAYTLYLILFGDSECLLAEEDGAMEPAGAELADDDRQSAPRLSAIQPEVQRLLAFPRGEGGRVGLNEYYCALAPPHGDDEAANASAWRRAEETYRYYYLGGCSSECIPVLALEGEHPDMVRALCTHRCLIVARILAGLRRRTFAMADGSPGSIRLEFYHASAAVLPPPSQQLSLPMVVRRMLFVHYLEATSACAAVFNKRLGSWAERRFTTNAVSGVVDHVECKPSAKDPSKISGALVVIRVDPGTGSSSNLKKSFLPNYLLSRAEDEDLQAKFDDVTWMHDRDCFKYRPASNLNAFAIPATTTGGKGTGSADRRSDQTGGWDNYARKPVVLARVEDVRHCPSGDRFVTLGFSGQGLALSTLKGCQVVAQPRYVDFNCSKLRRHMLGLEKYGAASRIVLALLDPRNFADCDNYAKDLAKLQEKALVDRFGKRLLEAAEEDVQAGSAFAMSAGQLAALEHIATSKRGISVLWGPPGTGKTHVLALTILYLIEAAEEARQPVRILVTAVSHAAVENLLDAVCQLRKSKSGAGPHGSAVPVVKIAEYTDGSQYASCAACGSPALFKHSRRFCCSECGLFMQPKRNKFMVGQDESVVVGCTVFTLLAEGGLKPPSSDQDRTDHRFDVVIIDEASQMPVWDATVAMMRITRQAGGHVVLAGDHKQLPPILHNDYRLGSAAARLGSPVWKSIFDCVRQVQSDEVVCKLFENRRMSSALTLIPTTAGYYDKEYVASPCAAHRCFELSCTGNDSFALVLDTDTVESTRVYRAPSVNGIPSATRCVEVCMQALAAKGSAVVVRLEGQCGGDWMLAEGELVATFARLLRSHYTAERSAHATGVDGMADGMADATAFWNKDRRLAIVTPHNCQRLEVARRFGDDHGVRPRIDTVEKIQGQEADVVVCCYGLNDPEQLKAELGFLYDPLRLNVAITRARRKNILVVSDALLGCPSQILDDPKAEAGMHYLAQIVRLAGDENVIGVSIGELADEARAADETRATL